MQTIFDKILNWFGNFNSQEFVGYVFDFVLHPKFNGIFFVIKIVFILASLVLAVAIGFLLRKASWFKKRYMEDVTEFSTYRPFGAKVTLKQWLDIVSKLEKGDEADLKLAVMEADELLDGIFKKMGYKGETMGEKIKQLDTATLPNLNEIIEAHKTRNNIVHDPDYRITREQTKEALKAYEQALRDLELF